MSAARSRSGRPGPWGGSLRRHWAVWLAAAFVAAVGLTLAVRGGRWAVRRWGGLTGGAQWIWAAHERHLAQPLAFYAARDFWLAAPPDRARLLALGDEQYVLYLNGKRVGAGGWRPGGRLDEYEVGALLRPGGNRLLAELRSANGAGGFLASLIDETSGRTMAATDGDWRTYRRHRLGLVRGWLPVGPFDAVAAAHHRRQGWVSAAGPGEPAFSWGRPPIGRWGRVTPGWPRPLFAELTGGRRPLPAASETLYRPPPATGKAGDDTMVLFDWGREITGYLALEPGYEPGMDNDLVQPPPDRQREALLWVGAAPPQPVGAGIEPSSAVVLMPGAGEWLDARLRRFRYALVIGLPRPLAARVYTVDPAVAARFRLDVDEGAGAGGSTGSPSGRQAGPQAGRQSGAAHNGVFGLAAPRLRSPVEDEVGRKLKRLPGVARREEL